MTSLISFRKNKQKQSTKTISTDGDEFSDAVIAHLHPDAHEGGAGVCCNDDALLETQRAAIGEWVKGMGKRLLSGDLNLMHTSFPVKMFEPRSYLQKLSDVYVYSRLISTAAAMGDEPLERLKYVIAWHVAGWHRGFESWQKPFNPILGETWQGVQQGGLAHWYAEQISHKPAVSCFQIIASDGSYTYSSQSEPTLTLLLRESGFKTVAKGVGRLCFADGDVYTITYPVYAIKSILYNRPRGTLMGTATFRGERSGMFAEVTFGAISGASEPLLQREDTIQGTIVATMPHADAPSPTSSMSSLSSQPSVGQSGKGKSAWTSMLRSFSSSVDSSAAKKNGLVQQSANVVSRLEGSWLAHLDVDGARYWTLSTEVADVFESVDVALPSDSRYREDLAALAKGDVKEAQRWKEVLENRQRADRKLRKEAAGIDS